MNRLERSFPAPQIALVSQISPEKAECFPRQVVQPVIGIWGQSQPPPYYTAPTWKTLPDDVKAEIMGILPPRSRAALTIADKDAYDLSLRVPRISSSSSYHDELKNWLTPQVNTRSNQVRLLNHSVRYSGAPIFSGPNKGTPPTFSGDVARFENFLAARPCPKNATATEEFIFLTAMKKLNDLSRKSVRLRIEEYHRRVGLYSR